MVPPIPIKAKVQPKVHVSMRLLENFLTRLREHNLQELFDYGEYLLGFDGLTGRNLNFFESSACRRNDRNFHLHGFHDDHDIVFVDMVARPAFRSLIFFQPWVLRRLLPKFSPYFSFHRRFAIVHR